MALKAAVPGSPALEPRFLELVAAEIGCQTSQAAAAERLLAQGATVPFIARYRKEATGGLDDAQLETLSKRRVYFLELAERRDAILASLKEQEQLTPELEKAVTAADTKQVLEDLYLPYKPRRRTRATVARERGLEPLADLLLRAATTATPPQRLAASFVKADRGVDDEAVALQGARDILAERIAEQPENRARLRKSLSAEGMLKVQVHSGKEAEAADYRDYFDHTEPARSVPSHRLLAILRGVKAGFLTATLEVDDRREVRSLAASLGVPLSTPCGAEVAAAVADGYVRLLKPTVVTEVLGTMRERGEADAVQVFRANLETLLLQPPYGQYAVMGVDPGYRTGCKVAVVDATGKVLAKATIRPLPPKPDEATAAATVVELARTHGIKAAAVGNGTGGREAETFIRKALGEAGLTEVLVVLVPETGASVYSASKLAREELPSLDVAERGAVSIARRLQDPLAELVKIEPRSLGVGQYQHDVNQRTLISELSLAVERAVHSVGVEVNSASPALLRHVSGLGPKLAHAVVEHRDSNGPYPSRDALLQVPGLGPKTYEVAAGFLRVRGSANPLDWTAVHPERYPVVEAMASSLGVGVADLVGQPKQVARISFDRFADEASGLGRFTLDDIRAELERPGRDPRPSYTAPRFRHDVLTADDLEPGMTLEGRVSNVTNFGAFVDIGVKRDGLVHLSELSRTWLDDPRAKVKVGDVVSVKVLGVDRETGRISLSMKELEAPSRERSPRRERGPRRQRGDAAAKGKTGPPREQRKGPPRAKRPERPHATIDDLLKKFGGRKIG